MTFLEMVRQIRRDDVIAARAMHWSDRLEARRITLERVENAKSIINAWVPSDLSGSFTFAPRVRSMGRE